MGEGATDLAGIWSPEGRGLFAKDLQVELFASKHSREKAINMKRFLFSMAFTAGIAALAVVARIGHAQTAAGGNLVILTESSALGQQLARDVATNGASVVTLGPLVVVPRGRSSSLTAGLGSFTAGSSAGQRYFITDLGTLGGTQSFAYAINDLGQVVGESWISGDMSSHAFLYSNVKMTDLYPLNSQHCCPI
jgi:probable HAF family extracellular repeat protein